VVATVGTSAISYRGSAGTSIGIDGFAAGHRSQGVRQIVVMDNDD
jgi:hypothetical protein